MTVDVVLQGGPVLTMAGERPRAGSIGIAGDRVAGLDRELDGTRPRAVVDLGGAAVLPGFHDAHCHTTSFGTELAHLDLSAVTGPDALLAAVTAHARTLPPGAWVVGSGYGRGMGTAGHPTAADLDVAGEGRPVWLTHRSGHSCAVSTHVLSAAGVGPGSADPPGGRVERDGDGRPNGVLYEAAADRIKEVVGPATLEQLVRAIDLATARYVAEGITAVTEAGVGCPGIDHAPAEVAAYQLARQRGVLRTRAQLMVWSGMLHPLRGAAGEDLGDGLDLGMRSGFGDRWLDLGAMKLWADGDGTAGPGPDGRFGELVEDEAALAARIVAAHRAGWQVAVHAMGDRALDVVLDALAAAQAQAPRPGAGHRVEHCALVRPDQLARLAASGATAVVQPTFVAEFGDAFRHVFGPGAVDWSFRVASLLAAGIPVAASSDRPVTRSTPLEAVAALVSRRTAKGRPYGPDEEVDVATALRLVTAAGADAAGHGAHLGRLRRGADADLVVLSGDPTTAAPEDIAGLEVLATVVGGRVAHDPGGLLAGWEPATPG